MKLPDFGKMIGPLPLGAWLAVVGVGAGVALYRRSNPAPEPTIVEDTSGVPGVGEGAVSQWIQTQPPVGTGDVAGAPADNDAWGRLAINYLIAQGYDATVSDSAIRKYLGGEKLSAQEYTLVGIALRHMGAPPTPLPPPVFAPPTLPKPQPIVKPPPKPTPKPVPKPSTTKHFRYYTVVKGDTLWGIASKYYHHGADWPRIFNANHYGHKRADGTQGMIRNPNLIYPGWRLIIP